MTGPVYPLASIPLAPIPGVHTGTGTVATTSWVVEPETVPGSGLLAFTGRDVSVTTLLFQIADDVVPNWFGVACPRGMTGFGNVHVFFHPTPAQAGYVDADYRTKAGKWPELFYYLERLGDQLDGAERDQLLVMPFLTEAAKDTGILPGSWSQILTDIATGTREPSSERMPSANAMSVAAGTAQPCIATASPRLIQAKTAAGTATPASAHASSTPTATVRTVSSPSRAAYHPARTATPAAIEAIIEARAGVSGAFFAFSSRVALRGRWTPVVATRTSPDCTPASPSANRPAGSRSAAPISRFATACCG